MGSPLTHPIHTQRQLQLAMNEWMNEEPKAHYYSHTNGPLPLSLAFLLWAILMCDCSQIKEVSAYYNEMAYYV